MSWKLFFTYSYFFIYLHTEAQNIHAKIRLEIIKDRDYAEYVVVSLCSDQSCYINIESAYIGLTNKPNEFYLDLRDSQYISVLLDPGGTYGHWYMPSLHGTENDDSLRRVIESQFNESKLKYGLVSNIKKIYLKKNKCTKLRYKLKFSETRFLDGSLSTQDFTYTLNKKSTYYLRLTYHSNLVEADSRPSKSKCFNGKFASNFIKFVY